MKRFLLSPDSPAGGNPPAAPVSSPGDTTPAVNQPPAAPPAASVVLNSDVKEEDAAEIVRLRREKAEAEGRVKDREMRVNELEDENRQLKNIPRTPAPRRDENPNTFFG